MGTKPPTWTLGELARLLEGELRGPPDLPIDRPVSAYTEDPRGITFAESDDFIQLAEKSSVGAIIVSKEGRPTSLPSVAVDAPRAVFGRLLAIADRPMPLAPGIHPTAIVSPTAEIDPSASIGPYAVIEGGAKIGHGVKVFPFCYVGEFCELDADVVLMPHAVLYKNVTIGARTVVHSGAVLGADGFGFIWNGEKRVKVPQVGGVRIGPDAEIGALTAIDRATAGDTVVGEGTKLDNFIQVGHNTRIGKHGAIASQTGISGSSTIGDRVVMGGQCALSDHVSVGDDVTCGGRTGVAQSIDKPGVYFGTPARPIGDAMRSLMLIAKLPELFSRIRKLEKKIEKE